MKLSMTIVPFFTLRQKVLLETHVYFAVQYVKLHVKFVPRGIVVYLVLKFALKLKWRDLRNTLERLHLTTNVKSQKFSEILASKCNFLHQILKS
jgi:hypothetical protein